MCVPVLCLTEEKTVSFLSCLSAFTLDTSDAASVAEDQTESIWIFHAKYFCHLNPLKSSTLTSTFCFNQVHCAFDCDIRAGKTFGWTEFKCKQTQATAPFSEYIETRRDSLWCICQKYYSNYCVCARVCSCQPAAVCVWTKFANRGTVNRFENIQFQAKRPD